MTILSLILAAASLPTGPLDPPLGVRPAVHGARSQVLNLGSPHLTQFAGLKPSATEPLVSNLARFRPDVITVEGLSGEQCDFMLRAPRYAAAVADYCPDPAPAQRASGLTVQTAEIEAESTLRRWRAAGGAKPVPSERRRLALVFLAGGDPGSASVQWRRLAPAERIAADGLDAGLVKTLNREGKALNETYDVGAALAARLGLERLYPVDDHSSDGALDAIAKPYDSALTARFARFGNDPLLAEFKRRRAAVTNGDSLLAYYRYVGQPEIVERSIQTDFGGALTDSQAAPYGRSYVAWWEVRNLRMVANWRAAFADRPGARVLNIVGGSHKPWYDAWARQMSDVDVVAVEPYLH